ncbi:MAG: diaminopimelate decarboxylase [Acidobacteriaceae bacterium]|nr:diaminopimelate decarboxylase [Acidobacteriaceae bacterium]MBV9764502.1 diaminopimelate decarboxylase [Acidobacteriaceae bacterium]
MPESEFQFRDGTLVCEDVDLSAVADRFGTPSYVYSKHAIVSRYRAYESALAGLRRRICYSVKANSNLSILDVLRAEGAGFDIVSGGELYRVLAAGGEASSVVFSGVGKTEGEIRFALQEEIHSFNCESLAEIETISRLAATLERTASIAIRVNPDVDAVTHPYISTGLREHKFGVDIATAEELYCYAAKLPAIVTEGVSCHIGSQLLTIDPLIEAADRIITLAERLRTRGLPIRHLDLGGGLGVPYRSSDPALSINALIDHIGPKIRALDLMLMLEPGRSVVAEAGVLLTRVLLTKQNGGKKFVVVDAAMNDLIRPALYQAHHEIVSVRQASGREHIQADVVGPICETGDFFARGRVIEAVEAGELLAIRTAGAYGFVLACNYNSRPRPCELLIDGSHISVAKRRESYEDLVRGESLSTIVHTDLETA